METQVPADDAPSPPLPGADGNDEIERRLHAIERRIDGLEEAVVNASEDMRRTVSDLGRLLLRDLDRLTKVLAEHRDAIVERLQTAAAVPVPPPPPPARPSEPANDLGPAPSAPFEQAAGGAGRWWALPGRRRRRRSPEHAAARDTQVR